MHQAPMTASLYLQEAIKDIDRQFNCPGYARGNPALVAAFMQVSASDFNSITYAVLLRDSLDGIGSSLREIANALQLAENDSENAP